MQKKNNYLIGVTEMTIANSFVGVNIILNKYLIEKAPLMLLLELRYIFGVLILLAVSLLMKSKFQFYLTEEKFSKKDWFIYLLMALSGGVFFNFIYMCGMDKTTATSVGIIGSSIPTIIVLFSFFFLKQPLKQIHVFCIFLVVLGVLILNEVNIFALDSNIWLFSFFVGLFSGALFYVFYNRGISKIDSNTAALMTGVIPISSAILAIVFLNEPIQIYTFMGMICVLLSIYLGVRFGDNSKILFQRIRQK